MGRNLDKGLIVINKYKIFTSALEDVLGLTVLYHYSFA